MIKAYQLKVELVDSNPPIWRRVIIPAEVTFRRLHNTIQFAMGWRDYHLYEFELPREKLRVTNDEESYQEYKYYSARYRGRKPANTEDPHGIVGKILETKIRQPQSLKIDSYLEKYKTIDYVYDFGDYWQHTVKLEKIINDYEFGYPVILEGKGACPPEDVGGLGGYEEFLEAWHDPRHPEHESMRLWGESQRYQDFDIDFRNHLLKMCLKLKKVK